MIRRGTILAGRLRRRIGSLYLVYDFLVWRVVIFKALRAVRRAWQQIMQNSVLCFFFSPKVFKKQDAMLAFWGALFEQFFLHLGSFFEYFFVPGGTLGSNGFIFGVKKWLGAPNLPQDWPKRRFPRFGVTFLETFWGQFFVLLIFLVKKEGS